jgi:hypothetical protein
MWAKAEGCDRHASPVTPCHLVQGRVRVRGMPPHPATGVVPIRRKLHYPDRHSPVYVTSAIAILVSGITMAWSLLQSQNPSATAYPPLRSQAESVSPPPSGPAARHRRRRNAEDALLCHRHPNTHC